MFYNFYQTQVIPECKTRKTPMDLNAKLSQDKGELLDPSQHRQMIGKLLYFTITRLDLSYYMNCLSQFLVKPQVLHLQAIQRVLQYVKSIVGQAQTLYFVPLAHVFKFISNAPHQLLSGSLLLILLTFFQPPWRLWLRDLSNPHCDS